MANNLVIFKMYPQQVNCIPCSCPGEMSTRFLLSLRTCPEASSTQASVALILSPFRSLRHVMPPNRPGNAKWHSYTDSYTLNYLFLLFERYSNTTQAGLSLTIAEDDFELLISQPLLLSAAVTGMKDHSCFMRYLGSNQGICPCLTNTMPTELHLPLPKALPGVQQKLTE